MGRRPEKGGLGQRGLKEGKVLRQGGGLKGEKSKGEGLKGEGFLTREDNFVSQSLKKKTMTQVCQGRMEPMSQITQL